MSAKQHAKTIVFRYDGDATSDQSEALYRKANFSGGSTITFLVAGHSPAIRRSALTG